MPSSVSSFSLSLHHVRCFSVHLASPPFSLQLHTVNYYLGKVAVNVARSRSTARDDRQNALQELVSHIHSIKLLGWSDAWIERVTTKRGTELSWAIQGAFAFSSTPSGRTN